MFYQPLMTEEERALQQEVRKFVRDEVSHDFIRALDRDEILYPREYVENLAAHNLLGLRFDPKWGGRGLPWTSEVIAEEEIGVLGNTLGCAFVMPSIVGEALHVFGTDEPGPVDPGDEGSPGRGKGHRKNRHGFREAVAVARMAHSSFHMKPFVLRSRAGRNPFVRRHKLWSARDGRINVVTGKNLTQGVRRLDSCIV